MPDKGAQLCCNWQPTKIDSNRSLNQRTSPICMGVRDILGESSVGAWGVA
jgi:hypothetical protein